MDFLLQKPDASPPAFLRAFATHVPRRGSRRKQEEELSMTTQTVSVPYNMDSEFIERANRLIEDSRSPGR